MTRSVKVWGGEFIGLARLYLCDALCHDLGAQFVSRHHDRDTSGGDVTVAGRRKRNRGLRAVALSVGGEQHRDFAEEVRSSDPGPRNQVVGLPALAELTIEIAELGQDISSLRTAGAECLLLGRECGHEQRLGLRGFVGNQIDRAEIFLKDCDCRTIWSQRLFGDGQRTLQ